MPRESSIAIRRTRAGAAAILLVSLFLTGCVPPSGPPLNPPAAPSNPPTAALSEAVDGDPDDGLTVTGGGRGDERPYPELTGGVFADDEDALAAAVATLESYTDEYQSITRAGDPYGGDLGDIVTPAMDDQVRAHLAAELRGPTPVEVRVDVDEAFVLRRIEDSASARVHFAYCREDTAVDGTDRSVRREFAASAVSRPDDPRHLRIEAIVDWMGEPFC
ncbi:hypothetical protein LQ757_04095 [Agromyces sp. SYSU K20354]|uniref:hypothetical protein n=1 Tax=Agromyces cavernae TaxID=2898659 RepID=UPI001E39F269|nr:hypothetical protein [Agromyces cavernae]MCD2441454.1 hypothetical protein [Agromyces cavernae]